ncbi:MAG TPA: DUF2231 domain-containing protein [Terriglobales bacterium]|jgi:nitrite reductase/ring-hydroxylating ferredoxin subunit/uncharacterized membrane protein
MATVDITGGIDADESASSKALEERLQKSIHQAFAAAGPRGQQAKNFLNGTWLGHPLHSVLTDIPVGAWTAALVCDGVGLMSGSAALAGAADSAVAIGLAGALAAAAAGITDWQDSDAPARRLGMIHGVLNLAGTALFAASLIARRRKARPAGRVLGALGFGTMIAAARLGGQMVFDHRVGVDRTAGQEFPADFTPVLPAAALAQDQPTRAEHAGVPILLVRHSGRIFAMAETCSHFSGPLSEGKLVGMSIECPWHRSRFALEDGRVLDRAPATVPAGAGAQRPNRGEESAAPGGAAALRLSECVS